MTRSEAPTSHSSKRSGTARNIATMFPLSAAMQTKRMPSSSEEEARRKAEEAKQSGTSTDEVEITPAPVKIRKTKNVSIKMMTGTSSWRLESKADIDKYIAVLRETLEAQLDEDTIVNVEF